MIDNQNYTNIPYGELFGISELFEWGEEIKIDKEHPEDQIQFICKLVQFSEQYPHTVIRARNTKNLVGISTINSEIKASNPQEWSGKYLMNEYGDLYLKQEDSAYGVKEYDSVNEFSYISTKQKTLHIPLINSNYDPDREYLPRTKRPEWVTVTLLGKAIIEDNGQCKAGEYCTLYKGDDEKLFGTVIPATDEDTFKLYVLQRISDHTIIVFYQPQIYS